MKKWYLIVGLLLMLSLFIAPVNTTNIYAQGASNFNSGVQLQNLNSTDATVVITAYNKDGTTAAEVTATVPGDGSRTYFPLGNSPTDANQPGFGLAGDFDGSVVVSSDQTVAAISNILATSSQGVSVAASYGGAPTGSTESNLPLIMKANSGFDTKFNVQNANSTGDVTVTVEYAPNGPNLGNTGCTQTATIKPGAAVTFDQATDSNYDNCSGGLLGSSSRFVGSAKITAEGGDIVATALEIGPTTLFAYSGFPDGSSNIVMPLINQNNSGFITGVGIQNLGSEDTDVTVAYTASAFGTACTETRTVAAGGSTSFSNQVFDPDPSNDGTVTSDCTAGEKFVGSAQISANSTDQPLVAIVNQLNTATNKGAAYSAFDPANATSTVSLPLLMDNNGGAQFYTGFSIVNVGTNPVDITCDYSLAKNGVNTPPAAAQADVSPGSAFTRNDNGKLRADATTPYVGSATCTASGTDAKIVGTVNELATISSGDQFLVYEGFNSGN